MNDRQKNLIARQRAANAAQTLEAAMALCPDVHELRQALAQTLVVAGILSNRIGNRDDAAEYFETAESYRD